MSSLNVIKVLFIALDIYLYSQAEKTALEKEQMAALVDSQREKTQEAIQQIHKDDATLQQLRRELKACLHCSIFFLLQSCAMSHNADIAMKIYLLRDYLFTI